MTDRRDSVRQIRVGGVAIGGGAPVSVQTMCSTKTWDVEATVKQIRSMQAAGADIVRIAIPDMEAAKAVSAIKEQVSVPLVADIHFDYRLALEAAARGINAGSLEKRLLEKYGHPCAEAMVESAKGHAELLERFDFDDICLSLKTSSVPLTIETYRLASEVFPYPLHLGVTETGTEWNGTIQSAVGIGTLLCEGIGNTIRVSLTADPVREVSAGIAILKAAGLRPGGVKFVSCPTCGRTEIDLISLATEVERRVRDMDRDITVAVMGCVVNGPGEAREADYGIAGGKGRGLLFKKGEVLGTYPYEELCDRLIDLIESDT